jgi:hypothetical protein
MEAATAPIGIRADYGGLALRTRCRRTDATACHTPGCQHRAPKGRRFCRSCQATLDRVRGELKSATARARKPAIGSRRPQPGAPRSAAAA